ncbi:MAG: PDZ domain-containing protein [Planctomycetes bacterium]|nr:PDZ domain-containing protein [Planctomycetota bacterium]
MMRARRMLLAFLVLVLSGAVAARAADKSTEKKLKYVSTFLEEVRHHLMESYIDGDKIAETDLLNACIAGMKDAMAHDDFEKVPSETRDALKSSLPAQPAEVDDVVDALRSFCEAHADHGVDLERLADHGARRMVAFIKDPYSRLFETKDIMKLLNLLNGGERDKSIGISISNEDGGDYRVGYAMYGYAAYEAGIEMGDTLLSIDGKDLKKMPIKEANEMLQAEPGTKLTLKVMRDGWLHPYEFQVTQKKNKSKDVIFKMIPGKIGYLRMTIFDMNLSEAVQKALDRMRRDGMKALVLDLRHNPGGALPAATAVADKFIGGNKLITYTESHLKLDMPEIVRMLQQQGVEGHQEFRAKDGSPFEKMPMVVLVDHASASASEMLCGALQDTGRAILIGETTYGKGVGQSPVPLFKSGGLIPKRFLYMTVMRYYLPTGRSIHHHGVEPDLTVAPEKVSGEKFEKLWQLRHGGALTNYLDAHFAANRETFKKLAVYDGFSAEPYPEFQALVLEVTKGNKIALSADEIRQELRRAVRERIQIEGSFTYAYDLQGDVPLQAAVVELAGQLGEK